MGLIAGVEARQGSVRKAIKLWKEILDDPDADAASVAIAKRQVRDLRVKADVQALESAVARFLNENGRYPRKLEELVTRNYIRSLPRDPAGAVYVYDPSSGQVSSVAGRVLGDS